MTFLLGCLTLSVKLNPVEPLGDLRGPEIVLFFLTNINNGLSFLKKEMVFTRHRQSLWLTKDYNSVSVYELLEIILY